MTEDPSTVPTLLYNLAMQDIRRGEGVCLIDPHGDLYHQVCESIPEHRANDVVLLDPCDRERAVGINLLECMGPYREMQISFVINEVLAILAKLYNMETCGGPMFEQYFRGALQLIMAEPQPSITMQEFAREHAVVMKGQVAPGSLYDQRRALRMFLAHVGGNRKLQDVKPWDAEAFVAKRLQEGVSVATVNKDIRTLKRIFNLAIEPRGYLLEGRNPFAMVKQRRYCPKPIRYVTPAEFQALTDAAASLWWKALLTVAYTTGARLGEILHLTWADVDFETSRIRICRKVPTHGAAAWEPKDRAERLLPVPSRAMQFLVDLQAVSEVGNSNVFISLARGQHLQRRRTKGQWDERQCPVNNFTRDFKSFVRRAGVGQCSFHDLRRSCITNWARALPIHVVRQLAGHSDMKTTQTYYLSVQEDDLERARGIQSQILETSATDPLLTHSAQKRSINGPAGHGEKSQLSPE